MAKIHILEKLINGIKTTIYPVTIPQAVVSPSTGKTLATTMVEVGESLTEMNNNIVQLAGDVNGIDVLKQHKTFSQFDTSGFYTPTGVWTVSTNWKSIEIIISEGNSIKFNVFSNSSVNTVSFTDINGDYISGVAGVGILNEQSGIAKVPTGATKAIITTHLTGVEMSFFGYFAEFLSDINKISDKLTLKSSDFKMVGVYINGVWNESESWRSADITIMAGEPIEWNIYSASPARLITFFDSDDNEISSVIAVGGVLSQMVGKLIAPVGTTRAILSTHATYLSESFYTVAQDTANRINNLELLIHEPVDPFQPKTIIVNKSIVASPENFIFNTIAEALAVANGIDTVKIFGTDTDPYLESGLISPDGLTIIGIGKPWIKGELPSDSLPVDIEVRSTLDVYGSCSISNVKASAKNMRYPIHVDFSGRNAVVNVLNCEFIHLGNKEAYDYQVSLGAGGMPTSIFRAMSAWGGGTRAGDRITVDGCYFESPMRAFSTHNNASFDATEGASIVKIKNSKMVSHGIDRDGSNLPFLVSIHIQNLISNTNDQVILENCDANGFINFQGAPTHDVYLDTNGLKQIWNNAGSSLSITNLWAYLDVNWYPQIKGEISAYKNVGATTIARGKAVKKSGMGIDLFTSSDNVSDFFGVAMQSIDAGKAGDVKFAGYIPSKYLTNLSTDVADGTQFSVNSTGSIVADNTHVIMVAEDNNNVMIK